MIGREFWLIIFAAGAASLGATSFLFAQNLEKPRPPTEAFAACAELSTGDPCAITGVGGPQIQGVCRAPAGRRPACVPNDGRIGRPHETSTGGARVGEPISTAQVDCEWRQSARNASLNMTGQAQWSCISGMRTLAGNGIPVHDTGRFPNPGNPNRVSAQNIRFTVTTSPQLTDETFPVQIAGYALNGIKFEPATAERCNEDCANGGRGRHGTWNIEALNQSFFNFGVDENNAHVQPSGAYHYHGMPNGLMNRLGEKGGMILAGFAADGFPIYARYDHDDANDPKSPVRAMQSSWRLRETPEEGRPSTTIAAMGVFTQDYEYVAGSGDLDECNGRSGATFEFPGGVYHYVITDGYPYIPRCLRGAIANPEFTRPSRP
jgi:hypothetical protein